VLLCKKWLDIHCLCAESRSGALATKIFFKKHKKHKKQCDRNVGGRSVGADDRPLAANQILLVLYKIFMGLAKNVSQCCKFSRIRFGNQCCKFSGRRLAWMYPREKNKSSPIRRNLSTRTSMFELVQQTFWGKKLVKSLLICTLNKVIYYKGTLLQDSTKPLFTTQNRSETSWNIFAICVF
jgi:hypothetical protein